MWCGIDRLLAWIDDDDGDSVTEDNDAVASDDAVTSMPAKRDAEWRRLAPVQLYLYIYLYR